MLQYLFPSLSRRLRTVAAYRLGAVPRARNSPPSAQGCLEPASLDTRPTIRAPGLLPFGRQLSLFAFFVQARSIVSIRAG